MYLLSISENVLLFISGLGIIQGFLLAGLIYFHRGSDKSVNIFLAFYVFFISCVMTMPISMNLVGWQNSYVIQPVPLLPGIVLYFYLRSFKERITFKKIVPHLIPVAAFFALSYFNLSAISKLYPEAKDVPAEALKRPFSLLVMFVRMAQQFMYYFLCLRALRLYRLSIKNLFSETSRIDLKWAGFLINGYLVLIASFLVIFPLMLRYPEHFNLLLLINMTVATPYLYLVTYRGFMQHTIWQVRPENNKQTLQEELQKMEIRHADKVPEEVIKPAKPGTDTNKMGEIARRITELMENDKLYQEPELTLQHLADKLQQQPYLISQAINDGMKKSFYDLVNGYRVEEAKRLLLHPGNRNYTILSVGFEAGFNSKTTFNTVFKKFTGFTPTEFRDKNKIAGTA